MNLEQIKSLVCVVKNKSFSQAAREMFVTQPTISMHIKTLENELGEQLLVRSTKDIILSEAGLVFYPYAVRMLKAEEEALLQMKNREEDVKGEVLIASSSVPVNYIMPEFIAYSRQQCAGIKYRISEGDSSEVIQKVLRFEQEIGVGSIKTENPKCICEPFVKDKIVLITPNIEKYRLYNGKMPLEELKRESFVVREQGSGTKMAVESLERTLGLYPDKMNIVAEFQTTETVKRAVAAQVGVAFVSNLAVQDYQQQKKILVFEFEDTYTDRQMYLIRHTDRNLSIAGEKALCLLRKFAKKI